MGGVFEGEAQRNLGGAGGTGSLGEGLVLPTLRHNGDNGVDAHPHPEDVRRQCGETEQGP